MSFISLFEIIKAVVPERCSLFQIPVPIVEAAAVGAKTFFAKGIATFIDGPANLLNIDPKSSIELF